jgi:hypothetical protein
MMSADTLLHAIAIAAQAVNAGGQEQADENRHCRSGGSLGDFAMVINRAGLAGSASAAKSQAANRCKENGRRPGMGGARFSD